MNTMAAFMMGEANRGKPMMVFDWDKAATLIRDRGAKNASAGLSGDWEYTGGAILRDGVPVEGDESYTYLASTWARPQIDIEGDVIDCYRPMADSPGWDEHTKWPESAKAIAFPPVATVPS